MECYAESELMFRGDTSDLGDGGQCAAGEVKILPPEYLRKAAIVTANKL